MKKNKGDERNFDTSGPMTRTQVLDAAIQCVAHDREDQYGSPKDSFEEIALRWGSYLGIHIEPHVVGIMLTDLKIVRTKTSPKKADNYVDGAGYLSLAAEVAGAE